MCPTPEEGLLNAVERVESWDRSPLLFCRTESRRPRGISSETDVSCNRCASPLFNPRKVDPYDGRRSAKSTEKKNIKLTPISQTKSLRNLSIEPEAYRLRRHLGRPIRHWRELTGDSAIRAAQMTVTWEGGGALPSITRGSGFEPQSIKVSPRFQGSETGWTPTRGHTTAKHRDDS